MNPSENVIEDTVPKAPLSNSSGQNFSFPKYDRYKDSGVEWLGEIPEHWDAKRNKFIFKERDQRRGKTNVDHYSLSKSEGLVKHSEASDKEARADSLAAYKCFHADDLVMNKMQAWNGIFGYASSNGAVSPDYTVFTKNADVNVRYFYYLFRTPLYIGEFLINSRGMGDAFRRLNTPQFGDIPSHLPPKPEQDRIVTFLDRKTAEIDALIAKKQRQIELLDEQKAILINRAVTRGLDPNAKLKPSGIEWIGDIPEHWEVVPIKRFADVQTGITLGKDYPPSRSIEVPYLRVANVQNGHLSLESVTKLRVPKSIVPRYTLREGDVLVAEGGDLDKLGRGCLWRSELSLCMHQNHVFAVRPNPEFLIPEFLSLALGSNYGQQYFMLTGKQTTNLASTNSTSLMNFPLARPSADEQLAILAALEAAQMRILKPRERILEQIQSLKTFRSSIIAHAVTGKIKVPE